MLNTKVEVLKKETAKIYRMSTLDNQNNPIMWVSAFLIDGLLIDFGHYHAKDEFINLLNFNDIEKAVLSHQHEDHFGACYDLVNKYNLPIFTTKEIAFLVRLKIRLPSERIYAWGIPKPFVAKELTNLKEIKTTKATFEIIASPGHCYTLISFFHKKKRLLFSTDAFVSKNQSVIFNWEDALLMIETLGKFIKLKPKFLFLENGSLATLDDVTELINYWTSIKDQAENLYNQGIKTRLIVKHIFGKESFLKRATSGAMSRENLIKSLLKLPPVKDKKIIRLNYKNN